MISAADLTTVDLLDDIDNLLFLCDRLNNRLIQVTTYVDEVKQTWMNKRRSIRSDTDPSPLIAQKVSKYNKILLNVAEKLAIVELQTESLHNLQSSVTNLLSTVHEKRDGKQEKIDERDSFPHACICRFRLFFCLILHCLSYIVINPNGSFAK